MYGTLTVFVGPMMAGKTTSLLKHILWTTHGEKRAMTVFKPAIDTRFSEQRVVSHDGVAFDSVSVTSIDEVMARVGKAHVVYFDEVQFFAEPHITGDIIPAITTLLREGRDVVATGLDLDWRGNAFPVTAVLSAMADNVHKLKARCCVCQREASKTFKKVADDLQVDVGASEKYEARCNIHWIYPFLE